MTENTSVTESLYQRLLDAYKKRKPIKNQEAHELYKVLEPLAENIKITIQMLIGCILVIAVLVDAILFLVSAFNNPSPRWIAQLNPLDIIAYGLFFSTSVDLAYMLFTPGPDEALEPVMTGLAAAILLGLGKLDLSQAPVEHGIVLFLAAAALAGLFATKKYLFHPSEKQNNKAQEEVPD